MNREKGRGRLESRGVPSVASHLDSPRAMGGSGRAPRPKCDGSDLSFSGEREALEREKETRRELQRCELERERDREREQEMKKITQARPSPTAVLAIRAPCGISTFVRSKWGRESGACEARLTIVVMITVIITTMATPMPITNSLRPCMIRFSLRG